MKKTIFCLTFLLLIVFNTGLFAQPAPPVLLSPPNGAINVSLFPAFDWTDVSGAASYQIQIFQGATTVFDLSGITVSQYTLLSAVLQYNTGYYWRVRATGSSGTGAWSGNFTFTTGNPVPGVPVLLAPANGSTNVSLTPALDWGDVTAVWYYRLQISTSNTFNTFVLDLSGLISSGYVVPLGILSNGITYYWRVNAANAGGIGDWSTVWNFTTIPLPPSPPTLLSPLNNSINVSTAPLLDWTDASGATGYRVQVSANSAFTQIALDQNVTASAYTVSAGLLSGLTQYYWRVSSVNSGGEGVWSSVFNFRTIIAPPAAPLLITPANNAVNIPISNVLLDWNDVSGSTSYRVQVSTNSGFTSTLVNAVTGSTSQYTIGTGILQYSTVYYWRANSTNAGGTGEWSEVRTFTTIVTVPAAPTLIAPANNATNVSLTPYMTWNSVAGADSYRFQISTSATFASYVINIPNITSTIFQVPSGNLIGNTQYYWRVAAVNTGGQGPYSTVWTFRTMQTFTLNLKVYLEGFYNGSTQVPDTIKVYLRNSSSPFALRDSSAVYLPANGNVIINFGNATNGSYYIVVKHRNHLETWSTTPQTFSTGNTTNFDFTNNAGKAYGNNMKQVGSVWVLYGGDGNADGYVDPSDYSLFITEFGLDGYKGSDFNGNSFVDGYDLPVLYSNFGKSLARPY